MENKKWTYGTFPFVGDTGDITLGDDHCDRLFWNFQEDNDPNGRVKGEPYCYRCPGTPLIGTHCCTNRRCEDKIKEAKGKFVEQWNKFHTEKQVTVESVQCFGC